MDLKVQMRTSMNLIAACVPSLFGSFFLSVQTKGGRAFAVTFGLDNEF